MKFEAKKRASTLATRLLRLVPRPAEKPELWLRPSADKVKATASVAVDVSFKGVDRVEFDLEPKGTFTLDQSVLEKDGIVRLLAKADGKATLIATGVRRGRDVVQRLAHLECEGPVVRIIAWGYIPAEREE
jgi:hypothetical protein